MTFRELVASGILPSAGVQFVLMKPLLGRYATTTRYELGELVTLALEMDRRNQVFPWANDTVVEVVPVTDCTIGIKLMGDILVKKGGVK